MAEGQSSQKINVTVKTPKAKQTIEIDENADIKEVSLYSPYLSMRPRTEATAAGRKLAISR